MQYILKNEKLTVELSDAGAEIRSVKSADGTEYLWQGNPEYWAGRATNLFPIVGRLTDGKYTYKGETYEMRLHGFARDSVFGVKEHTSGKIVFVLTENETTLKKYPFRFCFTLTYLLKGNTLETVYGVENTDNKELIFALGGHPGFNVPIGGEGKFEDWYLEFEPKRAAKKLIVSPTYYMTDKAEPFPLKNGRLDLKHNLFDDDAIVLADMPKAVTLKSDKSRRAVTVQYGGMKYLGLWHKPKSDAPYVCIEPWISLPAYDGVTDDLETKCDMIKLKPGGKYTNGFLFMID